MLEDLESVDWASLHHAYGTAEDVPGNIRRLTSDDPADWVAAIDALSFTVYHQGTVYDATPYAVPFLIELARSSGIKCRARVLELLAHIAAGASYLDVHGPPPFHEDERETPEYQAQLAEELAWARASREAVWEGLDLFLDLLSGPDRRVRVAAGYALGTLCRAPRDEWPGAAREAGAPARIAAALRQRLAEEPDELVKAGQVFAIATLVGRDPDAAEELRRQLAEPSSPRVELAAAMCLVEQADDPPVDAVDVLARSLARGVEIHDLFDAGQPSVEKRHHPLFKAYEKAGFPIVETVGDEYEGEDAGSDEDFRFPGLDWGLQTEVIQRLCRVPAKHLDRILPALLSALRNESRYTVDGVSGPILRYLFGGETLPDAAGPDDMTPPQRAALEVLFENGALFDPTNGNATVVLSSVGLPQSRWKWERLLDRPGWQTDTEEQVLANLDRFVRHSAKMPASALVTVEDRRRLRTLNLDEIVDADAYMPYLAQFPGLEVLRLCSSGVTDGGLGAMPALPRLKELYLYGNPITDEGAAVIARMPALEVLYVNKTAITDRGVKTLAEALPRLRVLILIATSVTDASIPWLARLTRLETLNLSMTSVSADTLASLRRSLPGCKIQPKE
jgi:hypothetical protein